MRVVPRDNRISRPERTKLFFQGFFSFIYYNDYSVPHLSINCSAGLHTRCADRENDSRVSKFLSAKQIFMNLRIVIMKELNNYEEKERTNVWNS